MQPTLATVVSRYGADAKAKLANPAASGEPEDQLRTPLERLFHDLTELCGLPRTALAAVGESSIASLKTRPDYAVTLHNALVGFAEVKAPGKGADPRDRLKDFVRQTIEELLASLSPEERLKGLSRKERLVGLSAEDLSKARGAEALEAARRLKTNGPTSN